MAENELLASIADYLVTRALLSPTPATIGLSEPVNGAELPSIVLSLEDVLRPDGPGEAEPLICEGALPWEARIDLADPVLPNDPTFSLVSADRHQLTLPHGGLVRRDGSDGLLGPQDLKVIVAGVERPVVIGTPLGHEVSVDSWLGSLRFARPLPPSGEVIAGYFLGQWEKHAVRITGTLRADTLARNAEDARRLSTSLVQAMLDPATRLAVLRLLDIRVTSMSSIGPEEREFANARRRVVRFAFDFQLELAQPDVEAGSILKPYEIDMPHVFASLPAGLKGAGAAMIGRQFEL